MKICKCAQDGYFDSHNIIFLYNSIVDSFLHERFFMISRIAALTIILSTAGFMQAMNDQEPQLPGPDGSKIVAISGCHERFQDYLSRQKASQEAFEARQEARQEAFIAQWKSLAPAQPVNAPAKPNYWRARAEGFAAASSIVIGSFALYKFFKR